MVETVVAMSRCLYAQIVSQAFRPPPDYLLPLPSEKGFPAAQLGMKLVSAFEMVLARKESNQSAGALPALCNTVQINRNKAVRLELCKAILWGWHHLRLPLQNTVGKITTLRRFKSLVIQILNSWNESFLNFESRNERRRWYIHPKSFLRIIVICGMNVNFKVF